MQKRNKRQKGRVSNLPKMVPKRLGEISLISQESGRISAAHFKSMILTLKRKVPTGTTIIPRFFPYLPVTKKPLEVRMGKGKGSIAKLVSRIRPNSVIVELAGLRQDVPLNLYNNALFAVACKLPVRSFIVEKKLTS
jgi:large subunit ribosomal protein L16